MDTLSLVPRGERRAPLALLGARLVDPGADRVVDGGVLIEDGVIRAVGAAVTAGHLPSGTRTIACAGTLVAPGLVDLRAFVGEPGAEHRETIASATAAAAAGGVTTLLASPDTYPPVDDPAVVDFLLRRARDTGRIRLVPAAALTKGLRGEDLAEIGLLQAAGARAFTDGAHSIRNARTLRRAMTYARDFDALVMPFAQDADLAGDGVMNEGELATRLGLPGIPAEAEAVALDRDMRLVALTGVRYHAPFVTTILSVEIIRRAKAAGLPVTAGTSINHLTLNEADIGGYRTFLKVLPPLRGEEERLALVEAVADGTIDAIASDHHPQDVETKRLPFAQAAFGAIGLQTMLPAALRLVHAGHVTLPRLFRALAARPAEILGLPQGRLAVGAPADLVRFDPDSAFILDPADVLSRCKNTPFDGARLDGQVLTTIVAGEIVFERQ